MVVWKDNSFYAQNTKLFLSLCIPSRDYSSCVDITALNFRRYLKKKTKKKLTPIEMKLSHISFNEYKSQRYTLPEELRKVRNKINLELILA